MYERYLKQKELSHHGILGQKWGVRRFQNKDGTLTQAGKARVKDKAKEIPITFHYKNKEIVKNKDKDGNTITKKR